MSMPLPIRLLNFLSRTALAALLTTASLRAVEAPQVCAGQTAVGQPDWVRHATIYEINVRQYSASGKFSAVTADLPRLKALGVDVLWFMPIHPIGEVNRKGELGSYYAVKDYLAVNPEFGTAEDFRALVRAAHAQGFRVIMDWVGNHTAWDNPLAKEHPEFYVRDHRGQFQPPTGYDWTDVIQLDFAHPGVLEYQTKALAYWVQEFGVDGFRCDFSTGVPTKFWDELFARLRTIRADLFFLAESELPQQQVKAFNASYAFDMMHTFNAVAQGRSDVSAIDDTLARMQTRFPAGATLLRYTTNHDENSWQGTEFERLGNGAAPFAVLSFVLDGIPLIYNGQEIGLDHRLEFFQRDPIPWHAPQRQLTPFYQTLTQLRRTHPAMATGASMRRLPTTQNDQIYALLRGNNPGPRVVAFLNLTARDATADCYDPALAGTWRDAFTGETVKLTAATPLTLRSWQYRVLVAD